MKVLGVTGNRGSLTVAQRELLAKYVADCEELHHGACIGADAEAHAIAKKSGCDVVVHPPINTSQMMPADRYATWLPARDYLMRNRDIVDACDLLIALPRGREHVRSGTWATVRYAVKNGIPVLVCYPDGVTEVK